MVQSGGPDFFEEVVVRFFLKLELSILSIVVPKKAAKTSRAWRRVKVLPKIRRIWGVIVQLVFNPINGGGNDLNMIKDQVTGGT